jgi:hypothetical protein
LNGNKSHKLVLNRPSALRFVRASKREVIIRRLAKHSKDKAAWIKAEKDYIQGLKLLQKNTVLTLEIRKWRSTVGRIRSKKHDNEANGLGCHPKTMPWQKRATRQMTFRAHTSNARKCTCKIALYLAANLAAAVST